MTELSVQLKNQISEVGRVHQILKDLSQKHGWSPQFLFDVELALEEILTNIVRYAFEDGREHEIHLRLSVTEDQLIATVEDDGKAFNPLEMPEPELNAPLEERAVGGLGIFLTRKMMDKITYQRENGKNILTLIKAISA